MVRARGQRAPAGGRAADQGRQATVRRTAQTAAGRRVPATGSVMRGGLFPLALEADEELDLVAQRTLLDVEAHAEVGALDRESALKAGAVAHALAGILLGVRE